MTDSVPAGPPHRPLPKVTVVTIVRDCVDVIERTLRSVAAQDYPNLEYLVVDGLSTDGTLDVIARYRHAISILISARDGGPYQAMNKGAALASGEWVIFMNGGDVFADSNVITLAFTGCDWGLCDVIYGDGIVCHEGIRRVERAADRITLHDGNGFSHQSAFVRSALQREYGFDVNERIAADYDLFLRLHKADKLFRHVDVVISEFFTGGLSSLAPPDTIRLRHRVYKKHFPRSDLVLHARLAKNWAKSSLRRIVPKSVWDALKDLYNRYEYLPADRRLPEAGVRADRRTVP